MPAVDAQQSSQQLLAAPDAACHTQKFAPLDVLEELLNNRKAKHESERDVLNCSARLRVWHEVERLFNENDPFSPESRSALNRTRVRFRGGGLDAAFKAAMSPHRERDEVECEPVVWDEQAVDTEEQYGDDLLMLRRLEERLVHDEEVTDDNEDAWFALLGLLRERPEFKTVLRVPPDVGALLLARV